MENARLMKRNSGNVAPTASMKMTLHVTSPFTKMYALAQQQAAHSDGERGTKRGSGNVNARISHQAEAQGVSHGCQQGNGGKSSKRGIGDGSEANSGYGGEEAVGKNVGYQHTICG